MDERGDSRAADAQTVARLQAGDEAAFSALVREHGDRVLNTCHRFLCNREDAEEVAQEVFIEVLRSVASFRREAQLSTWIYRIAVSKSLDLIRRRNRKKRLDGVRRLFAAGRDPDEEQAAAACDPARGLEQEERLRILQAAIGRLPEKQAVAFTLSKCEGFTARDVAAVMELSLPAVEALLHRAKGNLQRDLAVYFEGELRRHEKNGGARKDEGSHDV